MNQTTIVSPKTIEEIFARLDSLSRDVEILRKKLFEKEPAYGSDEWWEWSDKKAMKEIRAGKGTKITDEKQLSNFFESL